MPDLLTPQLVCIAVYEPNDSDIPVQAFTDGLNDLRGGITDGVGHREDPAHSMFGSQPAFGFLVLTELAGQSLFDLH
jgi:hypothetical protein